MGAAAHSWVLVVACGLTATAGCGSGSGGTVHAADPRERDAGAAAPRDEVPDLPLRPLGKARLDEFAWRRGPGRDGFARALTAEKRGDLAAIEHESRAALAADPGHLEAAWM